jgi:hypothetical protein
MTSNCDGKTPHCTLDPVSVSSTGHFPYFHVFPKYGCLIFPDHPDMSGFSSDVFLQDHPPSEQVFRCFILTDGTWNLFSQMALLESWIQGIPPCCWSLLRESQHLGNSNASTGV